MAKIIGNNFIARCIICDDALSSYEPQNSFSEEYDGWFDDQGETYKGAEICYALCKCSGCGNGALAMYIKDNRGFRHIRDFYPEASVKLELPKDTPSDILSEFRSAEHCASINEYRPAGAMLRSTLEKVLNDHGYKDRQLTKNINNASDEGVLTLPLKKRAFDVVKALGDEILHQSWKDITAEQYNESHEYTQRVIKIFTTTLKRLNRY